MKQSHPAFDRLLRRVGASTDTVPSLASWQAMLDRVAHTYTDADHDRSTTSPQELRRRAEHEVGLLQRSEERHRLLFDSNPSPMWVIDATTRRFVDVNDAMVATYGHPREELLGMLVDALQSPVEAVHVIAEGRGIQHVGLQQHQRKDGTVLAMDVTVHALEIDGQPRVLGIALDTTHTRRVEEELRQAQRMEAVGRLAGGIAHDFNNILAVILANAEFALEELGEQHEAASGIREITEASTRAARLTRQLLTFSRKQKRQPQPLALNTVVTRIEAMLTRIVGEDVAMSALIASDLGRIEADPGEVDQILMNLVVNARDAMPGGGRLLLETENTTVDAQDGARLGVAAGRYVTLSVTDTGCGMSEDVRARIFEPFVTTKDVDRGTGLGLATVFGIVKKAGGGISVHSTPGRGTTFRIYWPRVDVIATPVEVREAPIRGSGTVLVVEDDPQLRQILRRYLTSWGYTMLEAPNATVALEIAHAFQGSIDLLLTDLVMPGLDGCALSKQLLAHQPTAKVVFMSGYTEHAVLENAVLGPLDHFVQKPFTARSLSETLHRALLDIPP